MRGLDWSRVLPVNELNSGNWIEIGLNRSGRASDGSSVAGLSRVSCGVCYTASSTLTEWIRIIVKSDEQGS